MTLTQILQKIRNAFYTKKEIDSMGGGASLSDTISQKADKSDLSGYLPLSGGQMTNGIIFKYTAGLPGWLGGFQYFRDDNRCGYVLGYVGENESHIEIQCDDAVRIESNAFYFNGKQVAVSGDYLPLSGGQMTNCDISRNVNNNELRVNGGTGLDEGASLIVYGKDASLTPGGFILRANNGTEIKDLLGTINGLTWNNKNIDVIEELGTNYIRYSNGIQICWGNVSLNDVTNLIGNNTTANFPKSFISNPLVTATMCSQGIGWAAYMLAVESTATQVTFVQHTHAQTFNSSGNSCNYTAIGRWK